MGLPEGNIGALLSICVHSQGMCNRLVLETFQAGKNLLNVERLKSCRPDCTEQRLAHQEHCSSAWLSEAASAAGWRVPGPCPAPTC